MDWNYERWDAEAASMAELLSELERVFEYLLLKADGDVGEALRYLEYLGRRQGVFDQRLSIEDFKRHLEQRQLVRKNGEGALVLSARGERALRSSALEAVFGSMRADDRGQHRVGTAGSGVERLSETRPFAFGDSLEQLDATGSLSNALKRGGIDSLELEEQDLQAFETEQLSSCASVLLIDLSHSMILYGEDRITPAKQVALALCELITTRYPKDSLEVVCFGDTAWEVPLAELPYLRVGPYHTNTRAGLELARGLLKRKRQSNRQILMITDGKPSALTERNGSIYKNAFGLDERVVNKTLEEAETCRRLSIPITTFMLTEDPLLVDFVERFTRINRGRAYYSRLESLGNFVFVDYIRNRRRKV